MSAAVWLEMSSSAVRILEKLTRHGFTALRCIADGETVVSVYLVSSEQHVREAASSAARYYPYTQRLEVYGVRSSPSGAVTKHIVTFSAQGVPSANAQQQEAVSL